MSSKKSNKCSDFYRDSEAEGVKILKKKGGYDKKKREISPKLISLSDW